MDILLSIIGSAVLAVLLATAYTAGVAAGKAAAHVDRYIKNCFKLLATKTTALKQLLLFQEI